ncbi:DUF397 domain-containing protein [Streptomyces sp. NPDC093085]|uniref:DUF397 domain-containing protein n=1 Tax=Streptomyces sp. NPDC093085 TaxID=3155068 RepID=UPI0034254A2E
MSAGSKFFTAEWIRSSYSDASGGQCVEVAHGVAGVVPVRDSKVSEGPVLVFAAPAFGVFVAALRRSEG